MKAQSVHSLKGTPNQGLTGATVGFWLGLAAVSLWGPTAKDIKDLLGLNAVEVGFLVSMPMATGSLLRMPFGAWVDTTGGRKPMLVLLLVALAGMVGLTTLLYLRYPENLTMSDYPLLLLLGLVVGFAIATFSVGIAQASYWFPQKRQGWALGLYGGLGNTGPGIFALLVPVLTGIWGLESAYLAWCFILAVGIVIYYVLAPNAPYFQLRAQGVAPEQARRQAADHGQELFPARSTVESLAIAARIWRTWALVAIYFLSFGGFIALTAWLPTYWKEYYAAGTVAATSLTVMYSLLASLARVPGGAISDRIGGERTLAFFLSITLAGAVIMTASHRYEVSILGIAVMAVGMGVVNGAVFKLVPLYVKEAIGGGAGWVGGLGAFGGFSIPPILGAIAGAEEANGYATGFGVFVLLALASLGMLYLLTRTRAALAPAPAGANPNPP